MTPPDADESDMPDRPFPGARSQVPGAHSGAAGGSAAEAAARRAVPLEALRERSDRGWLVRLPVRAEQVTVSKEVVVTECVALRRAAVGDIARIEAVVHREELRLETTGEVEINGSDDETDLVDDDKQPHADYLAARQGLPWRNDSKRPSAG